MRLVPDHSNPDNTRRERKRKAGPRPAAQRTLADVLKGNAVCYAGRLATMTHDEFVEVVLRHGGQFAEETSGGNVIIVGEGDWPLADGDALDKKLKILDGLERRAQAGLHVLSEEQFLEELGLQAHRDNLRQLFSTARLTEVLQVPREAIRAWVKAGLIRPVKTELGVWYFDFREVSAARTLVQLTGAGIGIDRIRKSLDKLRKWMPQIDQPLQQLAILEKTGPVLVRLGEGDLSEPDGQLHFEFGSSPEGLSEAAAGAPSPLRITPGPRTADQWLDQGLAQEREGFLDEAAASYRQALMVGGPSAVACFNLANVLRSLGHKPQALERYSQAVEVDPDFASAWNNLGTLLADLGRLDDACAAFRRALTADPDDPHVHYNLADALHELGRDAEAQPHWRAFLQYDPTSQWGRYARTRLADRAS